MIEIKNEKTRYNAAGIAAFIVAAGLAAVRILSYFLYDALTSGSLSDFAADTLLDVIFTVLSQIIICFLLPMIVYIFYQKRNVKQVFKDANYNKLKWWIPLICVPIGIGCLCITFFVSSVWLVILSIFGYNYNPGETLYPSSFNPAFMLLMIFLTGVLPAICEEFAMRGNLLNALKGSNRKMPALFLAAPAFGLFHQNITQLLYTAIFGFFMAYLVIKTDSVIPAIVIHFVNNTLSVLLGFAENYGWGFFTAFNNFYTKGGIFLLFFLGIGIVVGLTAIVVHTCKKDKTEKVVTSIYRPSVRDNAWFFGAIVITALSTIFTFAFGIY